MKWMFFVGVSAVGAVMTCGPASAQQPVEPLPSSPANTQSVSANATSSPVPLDWAPPALSQLNSEATLKENFTLDRTMLSVAAGMIPDSQADDRQIIRKLDGVSVHVLRFQAGIPDENAVASIRAAYHLRGWKHLVTTAESGGPVHSGTTDVWVVLDGVNVRGAVVLAETPRSLTLVTVAGNLNPVDLLHLRGHFGIPRFDGDELRDPKQSQALP
jgi:hypothetical protein